MEKIRIGIIGFGFMGHEHLNLLSQHEGYEVVAVCDIDEVQLKDVPSSIAVYDHASKLLADENVQVVIVVVNNNQHRDIVCMAAEAGKDIICEKPAAMSVAEFDEMVRVTEQNGVKLTVHHQRRYDPDFRTTKEVFDSKTLGNLYSIKSSLYGFNGNMHDWHVYLSEGGGMLYDWGVHLLDQLMWMINEPIVSIFADIRNVINQEVDDYFKILIRFRSGLVAEVELGTYYLEDKDKWFERHWVLAGDNGTMYLDGFDPEGKIVRTSRMLKNVGGKRTMTSAGPTRSFGPPGEGVIVTEPIPEVATVHMDYFNNYHDAYFGRAEFVVKVPEVRRVLALMEAARKSSVNSQSVQFDIGR